MADDFGVAFPAFSQSELMIIDLGIGCEEHHAIGVFPVFDQPKNIPIERDHLVQVVDVKHDVAQAFDRWHMRSLLAPTYLHLLETDI
jgi:hypothetical protein